jgi:predicted DNA binding protein
VPVIDARLRIRHPCPYCDLSVASPASLFLLWCDNRRDTLLVSSPDPDELRRVLALIRRRLRGRPLLREASVALAILPEFEWAEPPSVTRIARRSGIWVLPPVLYADGRETYRLLSPTRARMNRFISRLRRLGEVELLSVTDRSGLESVRDIPSASVHFFEGLTSRQARSMVAAFEAGLFEVPARARFDEVARRQGLSRSTFGEHLRKAQLRIVENSYATLRARLRSLEEAPVRLPAIPDDRPPGRVGDRPRRDARAISAAG